MSLLNRLRPKWQNSDPDVRAEAVRQLDKAEVELLTAVAQQDTDPRVRRLACKKLDTPRLLIDIAENDDDASVREFARQRARQLLVQIASDERDLDESRRALALLDASDDLVSVVEKAAFNDVREEAFGRIDNDAARAELVRRTKDPELRQRAFEPIADADALKAILSDESCVELAVPALARLDDLTSLEAIADHRGVPKATRRQALAKLKKLAPNDHPIKVAERNETFSRICTEVESLAESGDPDFQNALASATESWRALEADGSAPSDLEARFRDAQEKLRALKERLEAKARETAETPSTTEDSGSETPVESVEPEARDVAQAPAEPPPERPDDELEVVTSVLSDIEAAVGQDSLAKAASEWKKLEKRWHALERHADADAKARFARAESRLNDRREEERREREKLEQATLSELQARTKRLLELADSKNLSFKEADKELRAAQDFLKNMGPTARNVNRKKVRRELADAREKLFKKTQDVRALEDWKRWANVDIQMALIQRVEELKSSKDIPKIAKELREIQEEWKKAGAAPAEKAEELWERYKATRNELRARCNEFFKKQNEERAENLKIKIALCERVETLKDSEDWNKTAEAIKEIQAEWKKTGPVPHKKSDAVWKRFRAACDHFFEKRKGHFDELKGERDENLKRKEALCERAESISGSTDWRKTADELKKLQAEWRTVGPVPRNKSDQIWKRFRKACDYFFDRYKRRDEVELEEKLKIREQLVTDALALAEGDTSEIVGKTQEIWTRWKSLGPLPPQRARDGQQSNDLQTRFDTAIGAALETAPDAFSDTELDPKASRKRREKLCAKMESLLKQIGPDSGSEPSGLDDLAARLKDALASNTITGGKPRNPSTEWRKAADEARRLRSNWTRTAPVPGDEGRLLGERFESAYNELWKLKPRAER